MRGYRGCSLFNVSWAMVTAENTDVFNRDEDGYPGGIMGTYYFESIFFESMR